MPLADRLTIFGQLETVAKGSPESARLKEELAAKFGRSVRRIEQIHEEMRRDLLDKAEAAASG